MCFSCSVVVVDEQNKEKEIYLMGNKIKLTNEQQSYIDDNYNNKTYKELSQYTGLGINVVKRYVKECGYNKTIYRNSKLSIEQKNYIEQHYSTEKTSNICKKIGAPYSRVSGYAMSKGLKKESEYSPNHRGRAKHYFDNNNRPHDYSPMRYMMLDVEPKVSDGDLYKSKYGKYYINRDYFENIDNEWKAYWLGFLYADGWVGSNGHSVGISLQRKDEYHIDRLRNSLQCDNPIYRYESKGFCTDGDRTFLQSSITINNQKINLDLQRHGCVNKKSLILKPPTLEGNLIRHFVRGYFDGDGWVSMSEKRKKFEVGFIGTKEMMEFIAQYFESQGISRTKVSRDKSDSISNTYSIHYGSFLDTEKIFNLFYYHCNIYLKRKFEKFDKIFYFGHKPF